MSSGGILQIITNDFYDYSALYVVNRPKPCKKFNEPKDDYNTDKTTIRIYADCEEIYDLRTVHINNFDKQICAA